MNLDLSPLTGAGDFAHLLWFGLLNALGMILTTWWGITATITLLLLAVTAYAHDGGFTDYDDDTPFLTESERVR